MTEQRIKYLYRVVDERAGHDQPPLMAVSIHHGVVPRHTLTDDLPRAEDLSNYKLCEPGDIVLNRMRAFQGAIGINPHRGLVSPDYLVLRPEPQVENRYLHHLFRSTWFVGEMVSRLRGIGNTESGAVRTPRINADDLGDIWVNLPALEEQRRIADFLDLEAAAITGLVDHRLRQIELLHERENALILDAVRGATLGVPMCPSPLPWLGDVSRGFQIAAVGHSYEVLLGKMLSPDAMTGSRMRPYLRNVNVQWDRVDTNDLVSMNFPPEDQGRFRVRPGDLLVCEGGHPGRAAIWDGSIEEVYYQKALHRIRARGNNSIRWLYFCLRAAVHMNVFAAQGNAATISHLTGEQLRAQRFPFPCRETQDRLVEILDERARRHLAFEDAAKFQIARLKERRQALITAAVTGQLDVATTRGVAV